MTIGGIAFLSWKHLSHRPVRSLLLLAAIALTLYFPRALQVFIAESEDVLQERASSTPLLIGPKGSSIDLTLNALYFTPQRLPALEHGAFQQLSKERFGRTIPLHARFRAGEAPIIGTSLEYFELRRLAVQDGRTGRRRRPDRLHHDGLPVGADLRERHVRARHAHGRRRRHVLAVLGAQPVRGCRRLLPVLPGQQRVLRSRLRE